MAGMTLMIAVFVSLNIISLSIVQGRNLDAASLSWPTDSSCLYRKDVRFGGVLVDCQGQALTSLPPTEWIPPSTTTLLLQGNSISRLENASLAHACDLRYISLAQNKLQSIDPYTFGFNTRIQVVDLEHNAIDLSHENIPTSILHPTGSLTELRLAHNGNQRQSSGRYSKRLFSGLENVATLTLDTFYGELDFNGVFDEMKSLAVLRMSGGFLSVRNDTFKDFHDTPLKELTIRVAPYYSHTEPGSFSYLNHLREITISYSSLETQAFFESLAPFVNRNFTTIAFRRRVTRRTDPDEFTRNSRMTSHMTRFLCEICVSNFIFTGNSLLFIDAGAFRGRKLSGCLVSIDLSDNPLLGNIIVLMRLGTMSSLRYFKMSNRKYALLNSRGKDGMSTRDFDYEMNYHYHDYHHHYYHYYHHHYYHRRYRRDNKHLNLFERFEYGNKVLQNNNSSEKYDVDHENLEYHKTGGNDKVAISILFLPKKLTYLNMAGLASNMGKLDKHFKIIGGKNLVEVHLSDMGIRKFTGTIKGIDKVETLDFSRNDGSELTRSFLESFPNARNLNLSTMNLKPVLSLDKNRDIFQVFPHLESLDLSRNGLYFLPQVIFSGNPNLRYIGLSGNHLKSIPFNIGHLANLQTLDLRSNSFLSLSVSETSALDRQASRVGSLKVLLDGNLFSCSCSNIVFLQWLQSTWTNMDKFRNFSCLLENGHISSTSETRDIAAFWRLCHGKTSFYTSLVLLCLLGLAFSLLYLGMKFQIQLKAAVFQFFSEDFAMKTPRDYHHGVYIGYADSDSDFVCTQLRDLIERDFGLTTFVRHRDLLPATGMAEILADVINSSWRVLLVATPEFLEDPWSYFVMKTAVLGVQAENPGRLVLVYFSDEDVRLVPRYVLAAVREESAIRLTRDRITESDTFELRRAFLE